MYRLTDSESPTLNPESYTYDGVGNRLTSADTTGDWTYSDNNELLAYNDVSYEYDDNGNMTRKTDGGQVTNYFCNIEDRLVRVEDGTSTVIAEYYYDPFGRRLWKEVGGVRTYFLYSDEGIVGEYDSSGVELKAYGYKPNATFTTDPLFMKEGDNYYFYQNDHLGTPQKITAMNGSVVWEAKYTSFGKATIEPSSIITNNLRFPGQYYDGETGLHYNYHRYYHSVIGRYLRADPIGVISNRAPQDDPNHLYSYVFNNPINWVDPSGMDKCSDEFWDCIIESLQGDLECITQVAKWTSICLGTCLPTCLVSGYAAPACFSICGIVCIGAAGTAIEVCHFILGVEALLCIIDYISYKRDQKDEVVRKER